MDKRSSTRSEAVAGKSKQMRKKGRRAGDERARKEEEEEEVKSEERDFEKAKMDGDRETGKERENHTSHILLFEHELVNKFSNALKWSREITLRLQSIASTSTTAGCARSRQIIAMEACPLCHPPF